MVWFCFINLKHSTLLKSWIWFFFFNLQKKNDEQFSQDRNTVICKVPKLCQAAVFWSHSSTPHPVVLGTKKWRVEEFRVCQEWGLGCELGMVFHRVSSLIQESLASSTQQCARLRPPMLQTQCLALVCMHSPPVEAAYILEATKGLRSKSWKQKLFH